MVIGMAQSGRHHPHQHFTGTGLVEIQFNNLKFPWDLSYHGAARLYRHEDVESFSSHEWRQRPARCFAGAEVSFDPVAYWTHCGRSAFRVPAWSGAAVRISDLYGVNARSRHTDTDVVMRWSADSPPKPLFSQSYSSCRRRLQTRPVASGVLSGVSATLGPSCRSLNPRSTRAASGRLSRDDFDPSGSCLGLRGRRGTRCGAHQVAPSVLSVVRSVRVPLGGRRGFGRVRNARKCSCRSPFQDVLLPGSARRGADDPH